MGATMLKRDVCTLPFPNAACELGKAISASPSPRLPQSWQPATVLLTFAQHCACSVLPEVAAFVSGAALSAADRVLALLTSDFMRLASPFEMALRATFCSRAHEQQQQRLLAVPAWSCSVLRAPA